jgi:hypothetical protein
MELVYHAWKQNFPSDALEVVQISQGPDYEFDYSVFDKISPSDVSVFIAIDEQFGNFKRMELLQAAQNRGFVIESFVSKAAAIADEVDIGQNVFVGDNVTLGYGSVIGFNTVVHAGTNIGAKALIGSSCWIESGVQVGAKASLGRHGTVRTGALIGKAVQVGWGCELGWPRLYNEAVADKTVFDTRYDEPIYVYGS